MTIDRLSSTERKLGRGLAPGPPSSYRNLTNRMARWLLLACALASLAIMAFIVVFMVQEAAPAIGQVGLGSMVLGRRWAPPGEFGLLPLLAGTVSSTVLAVAIALPLSLGSAVFTAEIAPHRIGRMVRTSVELLAGVPSVVFGVVGMQVVCPLVAEVGGRNSGRSVAAAGIVLAVMILPTVAMISEDAIRAVPRHQREAALALGATRWQTIRRVLLPAARSGIVAAVILGIGRAIGETMAMTMVIGNTPMFPGSVFDPAYTLTGAIVNEVGEAEGLARSVLFFVGLVLLGLVMSASLAANLGYRKNAR